MEKVSKKQFWDGIYKGNLNVHPSLEGNYPYTSIFKFPDRREYGRIVETAIEGKHPPEKEYFLNN